MEAGILWAVEIAIALVSSLLAVAAARGPPESSRRPSASKSIVFPQETCYLLDVPAAGVGFEGVVEGDEIALERAENIIVTNKDQYVAVLFYASWCPFSKKFLPSFNSMTSLFPSIPHFAFEESVIRPSVLSRYGVHGFPTFFLLHSSMLVRKMTSSQSQKGKAVIREGSVKPSTIKPDFSRSVSLNGWEFHDPIATAKPTPAMPGTHLTRTQRRKRSRQHYEMKMAEEELHIEALSKLTQEEVAERPWKDIVQRWNLDDGKDPRCKPCIKLQEPKGKRAQKKE